MTEEESSTITSLVGRMAMLETLNANMLAFFVLQFDQPIRMAASIMAATEDDLRKQGAPNPAIQAAALASFANLSKAMLALVTRLAAIQGQG